MTTDPDRLRRHVQVLAAENERLRLRIIELEDAGRASDADPRPRPPRQKSSAPHPPSGRRTVADRVRRLVDREGGVVAAAMVVARRGPAKALRLVRSKLRGRRRPTR